MIWVVGGGSILPCCCEATRAAAPAGSHATSPLWPIAALALLLCGHTQVRQPPAVQRGHWARYCILLCSSEHPMCYTHGSLLSATRDGGSKTEPATLQAASGSPDPQLY